MTLINSLFLEHGDTIDIVAVSSKFDPNFLKPICQMLEKWGLQANILCPMSDRELLCSTDEKSRFEAFYNALKNPHSKAIWNAWGGYGSMHLLPYLSQITPPKPKLLMGYSDTTALHLFVNHQWNWPSLHCSSAAQAALGKTSSCSIDLLKHSLFGNAYTLALTPLNPLAFQSDGLLGTIIGGNLTIVLSSLATFWQINPDDKFLFLEEVGEKAYRIDRMLHQLLQANLLAKVKGIILGDFIQKDTSTMDKQTGLVLQKWIDKLSVPIFSCKTGHGKYNHPIFFNSKVQLTKSSNKRSSLLLHRAF